MDIPQQCRTPLRGSEAGWRGAVRMAGAGVLLALGACTTFVVPPPRPSVETRATKGITYQDGLKYLEDARTNIQAGLDTVDQLDRATRAGVAVGVGGAGIAAAFHGSANTVLGLLTLGGLSYSLNQASPPPIQARIYIAGLRNLSCIEQTAARVHDETASARDALKAQLPLLKQAVDTLTAHVNQARKKAGNDPALAQMVSQADAAIEASNRLIKALQQFLADSNVGREIYAAVDDTVSRVNLQLRDQAPSIDKIAKLGADVQGFVNSHAQLTANSEKARSVIGSAAAQATTQAGHDPWVDVLRDDLIALRAVFERAQASLPAEGLRGAETIASCKAVVPGEEPVTVELSEPIILYPGGAAFQFRVNGITPMTLEWSGTVPPATEISTSGPSNGGVMSLAAPAGAKPANYRLYIQQKTPDKRSPLVEVKVMAAPALTAPTNARIGASRQGTSQAVGQRFSADRQMLGLPTSVTATSNSLWTGRVKKLDNCFNLPPSNGQISSALRAALTKHQPVNSAGDCPSPLVAAGVPPNPAPAVPLNPPANPAPNVAPIPKPPTQ
jgi:hypothetical protein